MALQSKLGLSYTGKSKIKTYPGGCRVAYGEESHDNLEMFLEVSAKYKSI